MQQNKPLIAITRTIQQSNFLREQLELNNFDCLLSPLISIEKLNTQHKDFLALQNINLNDYFAIIFISPNSVNFGLSYLIKQNNNFENIKLIASGNSTAKAIQKHNLSYIINDKNAAKNSAESVLELDIFSDSNQQKYNNKKILWLRGTTGKNDVINILKQRNFDVDVISCYQKNYTSFEDNLPLLNLLSKQKISALTIHSSDSLIILQKYILKYINENNFKNDFSNEILHNILKTPLFVIHKNIAEKANELSWKNIILCNTNDNDLILKLKDYFL